MRGFRNQTKRIHFDAHGREVRPGHVIGFEAEASPNAPPEMEPATGDSKGAPAPQSEGKGNGKGTSK